MRRLLLLVRNELLVNSHTIFTFTLTMAIVLFLYAILFPGGAMSGNFHPTVYVLLLFIGGLWTTSLAFKDMHDKQRSYTFLTLPCSTLEKFLSKLILTTVVYIVVSWLLYYLLSLLVVTLNSLLFARTQYLFNPFHSDILLYIRDYLILQAIFFLGAIYFKSHAMTKTILSLGCFVLLMSLLSMIFVGPISLFHVFNIMARTMFWLLLAPCCWVIAYIRLREVEVC